MGKGITPGGKQPAKSGSGAVPNVGGGRPANGGVQKAGASQPRKTGKTGSGKK